MSFFSPAKCHSVKVWKAYLSLKFLKYVSVLYFPGNCPQGWFMLKKNREELLPSSIRYMVMFIYKSENGLYFLNLLCGSQFKVNYIARKLLCWSYYNVYEWCRWCQNVANAWFFFPSNFAKKESLTDLHRISQSTL